jgi:hypothetical protein
VTENYHALYQVQIAVGDFKRTPLSSRGMDVPSAKFGVEMNVWKGSTTRGGWGRGETEFISEAGIEKACTHSLPIASLPQYGLHYYHSADYRNVAPQFFDGSSIAA